MNFLSVIKRIGYVLFLLAAVYIPAFALVSVLHIRHVWCGSGAKPHCPDDQIAMLLVFAVTAALALAYAFIIASKKNGISEFGVTACRFKHIIIAILFGAIAGSAVAYITSRYSGPSSFAFSNLPIGLTVAFFLVAAPTQEEFIFRGLLQTVLARVGMASGRFWRRCGESSPGDARGAEGRPAWRLGPGNPE